MVSWLTTYKLGITILVVACLVGTAMTVYGQKLGPKLPDNPIDKTAVASEVLLAGSDKQIAKSLADNGITFHKKEDSQQEDQQNKTDEPTKKDNVESKEDQESAPDVSKNKVIKQSKQTQPKQSRTYFTTTIVNGEHVESESYRFKIIQKEADLKVRQQLVLLNDQEVDATGILLLESGENTIAITVTYEDKDGKKFDITKSYTIYFNADIDIVTTIKDGETVSDPVYSFESYMVQQDKKQEVTVLLNGKKLTSSSFKYQATLKEGENIISLSAGSGSSSVTDEYLVHYEEDASYEPPTIKIKGVQDNQVLEKQEVSFTVSATDYKRKAIPYASNQVIVSVNQDDVEPDWSDDTTAHFKLSLEEGDNDIEVSVSDGKDQTNEQLVVRTKEKDLGTAVFSVEAGTVGMGTVIPPTEMVVKKNNSASQYVMTLLKENGYSVTATGNVDSNFYLSYIHADNGDFWNGGQPHIPTSLKRILMDRNLLPDTEEIRQDDYEEVYAEANYDSIGEKDFTSQSGWMFSVNGQYLGVGMSDYEVKPGDTIRVRYTLMLGADINGGGKVGDW